MTPVERAVKDVVKMMPHRPYALQDVFKITVRWVAEVSWERHLFGWVMLQYDGVTLESSVFCAFVA